MGPGWSGAVQILSTVPTVDWVLLGSGESNDLAAFTCSLSAGRTLPLLAGTACNNNNDDICCRNAPRASSAGPARASICASCANMQPTGACTSTRTGARMTANAGAGCRVCSAEILSLHYIPVVAGQSCLKQPDGSRHGAIAHRQRGTLTRQLCMFLMRVCPCAKRTAQ